MGSRFMKNSRKILVIMVLALVISIPVDFAFVDYYSLSNADFLSCQFKLEARDQIDLQTGYHKKSKPFLPYDSHYLPFLDSAISKHLPGISLEISFLDLTTFCLRC